MYGMSSVFPLLFKTFFVFILEQSLVFQRVSDVSQIRRDLVKLSSLLLFLIFKIVGKRIGSSGIDECLFLLGKLHNNICTALSTNGTGIQTKVIAADSTPLFVGVVI